MFEGKSFLAVFQAGGLVMYILFFCSILTVAVISAKVYYYWVRSRIKRSAFMEGLRQTVKEESIQKAIEICQNADAPFIKVALAGLTMAGHHEKVVSQAMEREMTIQTIHLERYTSIVGTIGSTAVYIGLLGTVLGIIRAFQDISKSGGGDINIVIVGISQALVCTAGGLWVSIVSVIAYNFLIRTIDHFVAEMEICASEMMDVLYLKRK